jgi:cell shape-determining protein MreC
VRSKAYETSLEVEVEPIIEFSKLEYVIILGREN